MLSCTFETDLVAYCEIWHEWYGSIIPTWFGNGFHLGSPLVKIVLYACDCGHVEINIVSKNVKLFRWFKLRDKIDMVVTFLQRKWTGMIYIKACSAVHLHQFILLFLLNSFRIMIVTKYPEVVCLFVFACVTMRSTAYARRYCIPETVKTATNHNIYNKLDGSIKVGDSYHTAYGHLSFTVYFCL